MVAILQVDAARDEFAAVGRQYPAVLRREDRWSGLRRGQRGAAKQCGKGGQRQNTFHFSSPCPVWLADFGIMKNDFINLDSEHFANRRQATILCPCVLMTIF